MIPKIINFRPFLDYFWTILGRLGPTLSPGNLSKIETESVGFVRLKTFAMIYASCVGKKCGSVDLWKLCADKRAHGLCFDADVDIIIFVCAFCCIVLKSLEECIVRAGGGRAGTSQDRAGGDRKV